MENSSEETDNEIIDRLIIKVTELEKREIKVPDYTPQFAAQLKVLETFSASSQKDNSELRELLMQQLAANPIKSLQRTGDEAKVILAEVKKLLPIGHRHHFDLKTRGWIISGIILLIVTAISTGLCAHLWIGNNHLQAVNIKYRMIKQVYPKIGLWADTTYLNNPGLAEKVTTKFEYEQATDRMKTNKHH